jgi:hypothetical protein
LHGAGPSHTGIAKSKARAAVQPGRRIWQNIQEIPIFMVISAWSRMPKSRSFCSLPDTAFPKPLRLAGTPLGLPERTGRALMVTVELS